MPDDPRPQDSKKLKLSSLFDKILSFFKINKKYSAEHLGNSLEHIDPFSYYHNLTAEDIKIPRGDIIAIEHKSSLNEIADIFLSARHTRMPVYKDTLDNMLGFINIKDIFPFFIKDDTNSTFNIDKVLRKIFVVPQSIKIFNLLEQMRSTKTHIALIVDEFGGIDGLITIEDLIEEFIGKIEDEHDQEDLSIQTMSENSYEANGRITIEALEEALNLNLFANPEFETLGGLIISICGHIPEQGEKIIHSESGLTFKVLERDPRRIIKVLITTP